MIVVFLGGKIHVSQIKFVVGWALTEHAAKTASKARKDSFVSANPLALGTGVGGARNGALPTPLGWLTDKFTGVSGR